MVPQTVGLVLTAGCGKVTRPLQQQVAAEAMNLTPAVGDSGDRAG